MFKRDVILFRYIYEDEYVGNITLELNDLLKIKNEFEYSYFMIHDDTTLVFRTPGSSKGMIRVNNTEEKIITELRMYDNAYDEHIGCFDIKDKDKVQTILDKYIGGKLDIRELKYNVNHRI